MDTIANDVEIVITADDRSGPAFTKAKARAKAFQKDMKDAADGSSKDFAAAGEKIEKDMGASFDKVAADADKSFDAIGSSARSKIDGAMAGVQASIDTRLKAVEADAEKHGEGIGDSLAKGITGALGQVGAKIGAFFGGGDEGHAESRGRAIGEKFGKGIADGVGKVSGKLSGVFDGMMSAGSGAFDKIRSLASAAFSKIGPMWTAVGAAALVGIAASASAAAGTVTLVLGAAFAGIGIAAATQSSAVKDRFSEMATSIKGQLKDIAAPMEASLLRTAKALEGAFAALKPQLAATFSSMAPHIDSFVRQFGAGIASGIGPALEPLAAGFNAVLDAIGSRAPDIMTNLGNAFETFGATAEAHADDFAAALVGISKAVSLVADSISWLSDKWDSFMGEMERLPELGNFIPELSGIKDAFADIMPDLDNSGEAVERAIAGAIDASAALGVAFGDAGGAASGLAGDIDSVNAALEEFFDPAQGVLEATVKLDKAIRNSSKALKDDNATRSEREGILAKELSAMESFLKADSEMNDNVAETTEKFMAQAPALLALAEGSDAGTAALNGLAETLGVTITRTGEATTVVDKFGNVVRVFPSGKVVRFDADTKTAQAIVAALQAKIKGVPDKTFKIKGEGTQATGVLNSLLSKIAAVKSKSVTITVQERYIQARKTEAARASAHGGISGAAGGGPRSAMTLVGEQGPELVYLPFGSTVIPNGTTERLLGDEDFEFDDEGYRLEGFAKGGKTGAKKKPKPKPKKKSAKKSIHQLTPPKKKAKPAPKKRTSASKVTYGVDSEGNPVELWDIPDEPKAKAKVKPRIGTAVSMTKKKAAKKSIYQLTPSDVKKASKAKKSARKSIHQLTPSDVKKANKAKAAKKSIHQLTPSDVHGGSDGTYIDGDQGGDYVSAYGDTGDGSDAFADQGQASESNLESIPLAIPAGTSPSQPVVNVNLYVQGSILSEREMIAIIRNEFNSGGFRGVLTGVAS